jgi:hypothetical protein
MWPGRFDRSPTSWTLQSYNSDSGIPWDSARYTSFIPMELSQAVFFGLPDSDPFVRETGPDPGPDHQAKLVRKH